MKIGLVIPARYASSRLPAKPLLSIAGKLMVERVWRIATAVSGISEVVVATDDTRIVNAVEAFGGRAVLTSPQCTNGTERVYEALQALSPEIGAVINLQGDALLTPPWIIEDIVARLESASEDCIVTPAVQLSVSEYQRLYEKKKNGSSSGTLVVFDSNNRALYFSKSMIPFLRQPPDGADDDAKVPVFRHIGLYGYTRKALEQYLSLSEGVLEKGEGLEQLRALEHGMPIYVVLVDYRGRTHGSVDNPGDIVVVESIISREGELVP